MKFLQNIQKHYTDLENSNETLIKHLKEKLTEM